MNKNEAMVEKLKGKIISKCPTCGEFVEWEGQHFDKKTIMYFCEHGTKTEQTNWFEDE